MKRAEITDKWHRICVSCGAEFHINQLRGIDQCPGCGGARWTRNWNEVRV